MAEVDPTINDPTPTGEVAERADCYRIAVAQMRNADLLLKAEARDVLELTEFLYGKA
ncbi:hypothetical protein ACWGA9_06300 [Streptomyces sp. NPDC054950]